MLSKYKLVECFIACDFLNKQTITVGCALMKESNRYLVYVVLSLFLVLLGAFILFSDDFSNSIDENRCVRAISGFDSDLTLNNFTVRSGSLILDLENEGESEIVLDTLKASNQTVSLDSGSIQGGDSKNISVNGFTESEYCNSVNVSVSYTANSLSSSTDGKIEGRIAPN